MGVEDLGPVALEAFLLTHATIGRLKAKGLLADGEVRGIVETVDFALRIVGLEKDERRDAANAVLKHLVGRADVDQTSE